MDEKQSEPEELELKIPDHLDEVEQAARAAATRPGVADRITDVIDRLVAAAGRPIDDPQQRAGPSGTYHPPPSPEPPRRDSSDNNDENDGATSRKRKRTRNPFILDEAEDDDDDDDEGELEELGADYYEYEFIDDD